MATAPTEPTASSRRASFRSNVTPNLSDTLSSPPAAGVRKSSRRPSILPTSTTSSAETTLSDTFDVDKSITPRSDSPITPICETPLLPKEASKPREKRAQRNKTFSNSAGSTDAPLRIPRKRSSARNSSVSNNQEFDARAPGSYLFPDSNAKRQYRASSAPTLLLRGEDFMDVDRLLVPGRYDSQTSIFDSENSCEPEQWPPSISIDEFQTDDEASHSPALELQDCDHEMADGSDVLSNAGTSVRNETFPDDISDAPVSLFRPYYYQKKFPMRRKVRGERSLNAEMLKLIQKRHEKGDKPGWVYVAESKEHGPEKLKIGKSGETPDKRIKKLEYCGLELKEITAKYQNPFYHFHFVEKVVFLQLGDQRYKLRCQNQECRKVHDLVEWFEIERSKALGVVEIWSNWSLVQKPFDSDGKLKPYWQWRAKTIEATIANVNWQTWTQPPKWNLYMFVIRTHFASKRKDRHFWVVSIMVTILSFAVYGITGTICTGVALLCL